MKKIQTRYGILPYRQFLMKMKITVLLFMVSIVSVMAVDTYAQSTRLTLQLNNQAIEDVLEQVENQSEFRFFYNEKVNVDKRVSLDVKNQTVFEILNKILEGTNIEYQVIGRQIALYVKGDNANFISNSQQLQISGTVTGNEGEPLPGVSVVVKGTTNGTVTNVDGFYSLQVAGTDILLFSFVGMKTQEIQVNNRTTLNVTLEEDAIGVEEVVVIGYGTRQKKDLTGAVSQINSSEITKQNSLSPELAMQGKMAGVYISNPGSDPTARPTIRIRGVSTLGYNDPLYVIDGIPLTEGGAASSDSRDQDLRGSVNVFSMINPNDIESISVLKDASATAIYGVRASNGVILITTKRGKEGKARVEVSAKYGIQNIYKRYDMASIQDYINWSMEAKDNNPAYTTDQYFPLFDSSSEYYMGNSKNYTNDWVDAALVENAPIQDYNISVSGGNQTSTYAAGAGYSNQENAMFYNVFDRYSLFFNSDHQLTKWLKIGESYRFIYTKTDSKSGSNLSSAMFGVPWQPVYDESNPYGYAAPGRDINGTFYSYGYGAATRTNFLGTAEFNKSKRDLLRNLGTVYAELSPLPGLRIKGTVSFDYYTNTRESYSEMERGLYEVARGAVYPESTGNTFGKRVNENINIVKELLIGYNNSFGKHNFDLILNAMDQQVKWNNTQMSIDGESPITDWEQRRIEEGWPNENKGLFYERNLSGLQGYMGRLSYNFDSKYYVDATVRRDGTSKFGPGYKWGTFPSFAAAWRISSEKFMEGFEWLDDLKIRAGWGQTGNQETRDYAFLSLVNMNPKAGFGSGDEDGEGIIYPASALGDFPIEDMSWETVTTSNFGFDAILLDNKLSFTAEYYNRLTDGILQTISIPKVIGALNSPVVNLAKVENKGFEFQATYSNKIGEVGYNVSANLTTVKNVVKKLYNGQPSTDGNSRIEEGYSINYIYGYKTDGIFQTTQEVEEYQSQISDAGHDAQKSPGDIIFKDIHGAPTDADPEGSYVHKEPDGKIDAYDQTYLGKTIPGYYYGISLNFDYKNWDLNLDFRGVGDVQKINTLGKQSISGFGSNFVSDYKNRWTETNPGSSIPRAVQSDPAGNNRISDRHVEDAGFLRFQNFQIGYNFSGNVIEKIGLNNLRCYVSGSNIFVISPYSDLDPEDISTPTTFSLGVNLSF
ncbi:SusC/RagA family TonB-linked outer membrane protein [Maribellus comscasis]|uniref:SusC/RagA family TonB-linked outer membrane protein n=1 Tax=Maribellus comscasis TaxID=2681766 RepID=A0A6I6JSF6_9BACT|nr:TonB-dependent receptor [Maribellus comscasis]QGY44030.1 SusC/RagA family TonB-linked outer membrane protein [Maribellus comscasis]